MRKISIVGVEGSGKTVLLSAIGDKYENPDVSGVFMSPENARAFGFVKLHMEALRNGQWPAATTTNSNLDWTLFKKNGNAKEVICQLSLLDFAGELYRLCFGEHSEDEIGGWADEMATLKKHIAESDLLIVIVNLSDVINASPSNSRARETMWLTKSVIDYATRNGNSKEVAIVFSQADIYKEEIESCGGTSAALQKYLPHVANVYDNLPVFAISAINKTIPDDNTGLSIPAKDFQSEGLDELMEWIIAKTPGYETLAQSMTDTRLAPIRLWEKVQSLYEQYQNNLSSSTMDRYSLAKELVNTFQELQTANEKSPKNARNTDDVWSLAEKSKEFLEFESMAYDIMSSVELNDKDKALTKLDMYATQSGQIAAQRAHLELEINSISTQLQANHNKLVKKKKLTIIASILTVVFLAVLGWFLYTDYQQRQYEEYQRELALRHEQDMREKEEQGYEIVEEYGRKNAIWRAGKIHPRNSSLIADSQEGRWICKKPGYVWSNGSEIKWQQGLTHPDNSYLKSSSSEGKWICTKPGYVWTGNAEIAWRAGQTSDQYPHWVSVEQKEYWKPQEGYRKKNPEEKGLGELIWNPNEISGDGLRKASYEEGRWLHKKTCGVCNGNGTVSSSSTCWTCNGTGKVESTETCSSCNGNGNKSSSYECSLCDGSGRIDRIETCPNCNGVPKQRCNPRLGLLDRPPEYTPAGMHAVRCTLCGGSGQLGVPPWVSICNNCGGRGGWPCRNCGGDGWWECNQCSNGKINRGSINCSRCNGTGRRYSSSNCSLCDGTGRVKIRRNCSSCSAGKRWSKNSCSKCNGNGFIWE